MVLINKDETTSSCDDCVMVAHLLSLPKRADSFRTPAQPMDAAGFAVAMWAGAFQAGQIDPWKV